MPDPDKHLDADLVDERIVRFAAKWADVKPEVREKIVAEISGERSPIFYRGMLAGLNIGYQLTGIIGMPGNPAQSQAGSYIAYCCKLIADKEGLGAEPARPIDL